MAYADDLRHPKWQRKRLEVLSAAEWRCSFCAADDRFLHVHHRLYLKGRRPWEYDNEDLISLCEECHKLFHTVDDVYKSKEFEEKLQILKRILGSASKLQYSGPLAFAEHPSKPGQCLVIHIPSAAWHGFTLSMEAALERFDGQPENRAELLKMILYENL